MSISLKKQHNSISPIKTGPEKLSELKIKGGAEGKRKRKNDEGGKEEEEDEEGGKEEEKMRKDGIEGKKAEEGKKAG